MNIKPENHLPPHFQLPATELLIPLHQGSLDALCGLYSIINAVRLMLYPERLLTTQELKSLFHGSLDTYRRHRSVAKLVCRGMSEKAWFEMTRSVLEHASTLTGIRFDCSLLWAPGSRFTRAWAIGAIERHIGQGYPVLIGLGGILNHYSVISGYGPHRLLLFDSSTQKWIAKRCLGVEGGKRRSLHWVTRTGLIAVSRGSLRQQPMGILE